MPNILQHNLKNLCVLITKPKEQALNLISCIEKLGGTAISLPMINIENISDEKTVRTIIKNIVEFDIAIFVSPTAVDKTLPILFEYRKDWPAQVKIAAIGSSTAKKLAEQNFPIDIVPSEKFSSEALLEQPALKNCSGERIVIFQGNDGRELLSTTLQARGANITQAIIYQRVAPHFTDENYVSKTIFEQNKINVIICTSNMSLQNLYHLTNPTYRLKLQSMPLLVGSIRQVDLAKTLGFHGRVIVAKNATDDALIDELAKISATL